MEALDSVAYDNYARQGVQLNFSYHQYINAILDHGWKIDDLGMSSIVYWVYSIFGSGEFGRNVMLLINAIIIVWATSNLDKLAGIFNIESGVRSFIITAFGCFPFLSLTGALGLKENFFIFLVVSSFYYSYAFWIQKRRRYLIIAILFVVSTMFFRMATFAMVAFSVLLIPLSTYKNKKVLLYGLIIGTVIIALSLDMILGKLYGRSLDQVLSVTNNRAQRMNSMGGSAKWIIQSLAVLCGPFPNFSRSVGYTIIHSSGTLFKAIIDFYALATIYSTIRKFDYTQYPFLAFLVMNFVMLVLGGVALDLRYQIIIFPIVLIMAAKAIQKNKYSLIGTVYMLFLIALIFFYNIR